jgi:hypothetical protein
VRPRRDGRGQWSPPETSGDHASDRCICNERGSTIGSEGRPILPAPSDGESIEARCTGRPSSAQCSRVRRPSKPAHADEGLGYWRSARQEAPTDPQNV